jgi:hypothetical protein
VLGPALALVLVPVLSAGEIRAAVQPLRLNDLGYFEGRGLNVLVFSNWYSGLFSDSKISGVEIIQHEVRTATNGDVRLSPTPGQWDPIPELAKRTVDAASGSIEARLRYADHGFDYAVRVEAHGDAVRLSVDLPKPLPVALAGRAGFNLEFLPSAYFEKGYLVDGKSGIFPLHPTGPTTVLPSGEREPRPIASGHTLVLAPEDPARRVTIRTLEGELQLYDGRNTAQNGWFVVRSLLPTGRSGTVVEWELRANTIPDWTRPPVVAYSQLGYHPAQRKVAVVELDRNEPPLPSARLLRVTEGGDLVEAFSGAVQRWGRYLRYEYARFDFTAVSESGLYLIEYGKLRTKPFRIAPDVLERAWWPTLDVFLPVQMDHVLVREAYRVWHGASHLDDARQAPPGHVHFDLYAQGPTTDTPYAAGEHIPGLNVGGWFDAGDYDIRTQTQYAVVLSLVEIWERFHLDRDETTVDEARRFVEIHAPDGKPDLLQQIAHGTLALLAQQRALGHAIPGIIEPDLVQYRHLGDASSKTDNRIYDRRLKPDETDGLLSGVPDDRWAFTTHTTALNYGSAAALAAASRALRGYDDALAEQALRTARRVWDEEHAHPPALFRHGNTTGGPIEDEELRAAVELLVCTGDAPYRDRIEALWPALEKELPRRAALAVRALPLMGGDFARRLEASVRSYKERLDALARENPFGVPIATGGWAGNGQVIGFAITTALLHKAFPAIIDRDHALRALDYVHGCHPGHNLSFVSGVGTQSKQVAYGSNRADFTFIPGGIVPGVLILTPDFPENKEDWPFLWGENEYVVNLGPSYVLAVNAARELLSEDGSKPWTGGRPD